MRRFLLVLGLLIAIFLLFTKYFTIISSRPDSGIVNVVIVNKSNGKIHRVLGR